MPEGTDLVVGGGRTAGGRCIIPVIRTFTLCVGGAAALSLTPVALLVVEGRSEYLALLPGAPRAISDLLETLRDDIEREKERCLG
ncbi:hypothetical protein [Methanoculleus horonobensis]|uniref:hypothetical protein n=1 Tax=Methanoculleus horonobensis TaxID=528314 RepID=UPI000AD37139|nr:hypothetical protein [Methanoculleus horonobensis]MDD3070597.1 hypothetical protein [Methanoculleus horonobensis]MDD4253601.1 hypothetical protein [Methanoculleus horonobensis]